MSCISSITPKLTRKQLREIKKQKLNYSSPAPRASLVRRLELLANSSNPKIRERAALDYRITDELQEKLSNDYDELVRACLAQNEHLSWNIIYRLAEDPAARVRTMILFNKHCPPSLIRKACDDPNSIVRKVAKLLVEA